MTALRIYQQYNTRDSCFAKYKMQTFPLQITIHSCPLYYDILSASWWWWGWSGDGV